MKSKFEEKKPFLFLFGIFNYNYGCCNLDIPIDVAIISFFRENVVVRAISEVVTSI